MSPFTIEETEQADTTTEPMYTLQQFRDLQVLPDNASPEQQWTVEMWMAQAAELPEPFALSDLPDDDDEWLADHPEWILVHPFPGTDDLFLAEDTADTADEDNGYPQSGSHHISQGRVFNRIDLFNPNHDKAGRFAGAGATGVGGVEFLQKGGESYATARGMTYQHIDPTVMRADPNLGRAAAVAYEALPVHDPAAIPAYEAMRSEIGTQYDHLTQHLGVTVEVTAHDPYVTAAEMAHDVGVNKHLAVLSSAATGGHPFFTNTENDQFRAVHDAFGHAAVGGRFDRHGERAAFLQHKQMFTPLAARAMATETHGQNSAFIWSGAPGHRVFPVQKLALLPENVQ